jgi:hypothetical protein
MNFSMSILDVDLLMQRETGENATIFGTLRDLYKLLMIRHLPSTQEWLSTLMRVDPPQEKQQRDVFLKEVIDLRSQLLAFRKHCEDLGIELLEVRQASKALTTVEDEGEDDIIWEEGGSGFSFAEAKSVSQSVKTDEGESLIKTLVGRFARSL